MRVFFLVVLSFGFIQFTTEVFLVSDELIYDSLISRLSLERISEMLAQGKKWKWLSYVFLPIFLLIKILFVVICFSIGGLFLNIESSFKKFFTIVTKAEFVFLIPGVIKLFWFSFFQTNYTLQDLQFFSPLSAISFFNPTELDPWLAYPLQLLNVFEVVYWLLLAYQLKPVLNETFPSSLGFVGRTYGVGLIVWVILVMFLIVSIS
jgi:hypothetical protein